MTCRHFGVCGGCSLPGVPYAEQVARKQAQMRAWFPDVALEPLVPSPQQEAFRHKVAFVFAPHTSGARLVMGHYRAASKRVEPIAECPVHAARGNALAFALRDLLARSRVPPGILRHVLVRTTDDGKEAVMMLVVTANHKALRTPIRALLDGADPPDGFFLNVHDRPDSYMVGRETIRLAGRSHVKERMLDTSFLISPTAFFQTNVRAARELLRIALEWTAPARRVLDLYSGSGLFALPLARAGASVVAVEENRQAMQDAETNLRLNRMEGAPIRLVARRVEDALDGLRRSRADAIVLDPPRQGCPDTVIDGVSALGPSRIVYVSCNPERLAVERVRFATLGYTLTKLRALDMFPHTEHIEAIGLFEPAASPRA